MTYLPAVRFSIEPVLAIATGAVLILGSTHNEIRMEPRISIVTLGVRDLQRSISFYQDGLGLPIENDGQGIAFFAFEGTKLALYPRDKLAEDATVDSSGSGFSGITLSHNVRTKEEVDAVLRLAASVGGRIVKPAQEVFWGGYSGYFEDPDGHLWEVAWNPHFDFE